MLRLTPAQWSAVDALADAPKVRRIFKRVNLGEPAGIDAAGNPSPSPAFYVFDDDRFGGFWRIRVGAGPTVFFQEWDALVNGNQLRELTLAETQAVFGST
jgi:hypothetical protein